MKKPSIKGLSLMILCKMAGVPGRLRHGEDNHIELRKDLKVIRDLAVKRIKEYFGK